MHMCTQIYDKCNHTETFQRRKCPQISSDRVWVLLKTVTVRIMLLTYDSPFFRIFHLFPVRDDVNIDIYYALKHNLSRAVYVYSLETGCHT